MAGFDNSVVYGTNIDFSNSQAGKGGSATMLLDGQLLTGSTALNAGGTHCNIGVITSPLGTVQIGYSIPNITIDIAGGKGGYLAKLADDVGSIVLPNGASTIQLVGHINEQGSTKFSTVTAGLNIMNINPMASARWIVDPLGFNGTHTTLASALTSATSGDTILLMPGTYSENVTLKAGVNITANRGDCFTPNVTISGTCSFSAAGTVSISDIRLQTNSAALLSVTGSANSIVNLVDCYINCTNNTGIINSSSGASNNVLLTNCNGDLGTTGIAIYTCSNAGNVSFNSCEFTNSGSSLTASSNSGTGSNQFGFSHFQSIFSVSSSATIGAEYTTYDLSQLNIVPITTAGTGASTIFNFCRFLSGTAACVSVGSGTTVGLQNCTFNSTNTNPLTGSGTINLTAPIWSNTGTGVNVSTINDYTFGRQGSFTPVLAFGGASVGITYLIQNGFYVRIGHMCYFNAEIALTNKGSSTGTATFSLPFTSQSSDSLSVTFQNVTLSGYATAFDTYSTNFKVTTSASSYTLLTNTAFANNSVIFISGCYQV